jgi:hypothetical protein
MIATATRKIVMATTDRFVVTGDQAHRIANASAELHRQLFLQRDTKLDPERVIANLQGMTEGKLPLFAGGLRGRFVRTMPLLIGGVSKLELIEQVKAVRTLGNYAESMIRHEAFTTLTEQELALQIELLVEDLGFTEEPPTNELFDEGRLAQWSAANLEDCAIELNPAEVGPHMAIQYARQPKGETVFVAMKPTPDADGHPLVFVVERDDGGELWLSLGWTGPHDPWLLDDRLSFRLRKLSSALAV